MCVLWDHWAAQSYAAHVPLGAVVAAFYQTLAGIGGSSGEGDFLPLPISKGAGPPIGILMPVPAVLMA